MKVLTRSMSVVLTVLCAGTLVANVAPAAPDQVRAQLSSYFKNIGTNSPTVLGGLAKSPDAMAAIQERIAKMSDAEAAKLQKLLSETPDWQIAPEAFAGAFPPEMLEQIKRVGADYTAAVPKAEKMRDDVRTLVEVLKRVPDTRLQELGIDRKMIASLGTTFEQMTPLQVAMLQRQATGANEWNEKSALAIHTLPPALQRGAMALTAHGALSEKDIAELNMFRDELVSVLSRIDTLPPSAREKLKIGPLAGKMEQIRNAPPDVLFMVRHNLSKEMMATLKANVAFLERLSNFSDEEKKQLDEFRSELGEALHGTAGDDAQKMLAGLGPDHLFMLRKQMGHYGEWQTALPVVYQTMSAPELPDRLRLVEGPAADPGTVESLEEFRAQALRYIDAAGPTSGLDAELVKRARASVESAPLKRLELIRMTVERLPAGSSDAAKLSVALMHDINFGCDLSFTAVPRACVVICDPTGILGCAEVCTPAVEVSVSFDFICNPLEDAMEAVEHSVTSVANGIVSTMQAGINTAISNVQSAINNAIAAVTSTIDNVVSAITSTVNDVWTFLQQLPGKAWDAIKAALNLLLDIEIRNGITLRDLVGRGAEHALTSMKTLLGLAEGWWNAVSTFTLPAIPCPPAGFHTPFGDVGDSAASDNYGRYKLVIDGIIGMIPDTETSLAIKIPAQVLYMAFDFLGLCLEQASAAADSAQLTSRHNLVVTNFANTQIFVSTQISGLAAASGTQTNTILALISAQSQNIQNSTRNHSSTIQTLVNSESTEMHSLIDTESTKIQNLIQAESDDTQNDVAEFQELNLRLTIERVLQAGTNNEVGHLQLRAPWGRLQRVSEIVKESIDSMSTSGEGIGQARKYYDTAMALMADGKDKEAFRQFALAYRETTK